MFLDYEISKTVAVLSPIYQTLATRTWQLKDVSSMAILINFSVKFPVGIFVRVRPL